MTEKEIKDFLPENPNGTFDKDKHDNDGHPEQVRRDLISDFWKHYLQAYDWHGLQHLKDLYRQMEKRAATAANMLMNADDLTPETIQNVEGYAFQLNDHCIVLDRMIQEHENKGTIGDITAPIHNELSVQLNKGGYDKKRMKSLYNELKELPEYQKNNGTPHKTKIREEIRERMKEKKDTGQVVKPSMKTVKRHTP